VTGDVPTQSYSRREVRRLLDITERQLRGWEKQDLIARREPYGFADLLALRTLAKLRKNKVPTAKIRRALAALREKLQDVENPLVELRLFSDGKNIRVQVGRQTMEPVSGQLLLDFGEAELRKLVSFPGSTDREASAGQRERSRAMADRLFEEALELEQAGAPLEAIEGYRKVLEVDPSYAGALVNLGTIFFTARDLEKAEQYYMKAIEADQTYALAHFNLGNLCDELGKRAEALLRYQTALRLQPDYADAHYNLALLYQAIGQVLRAMRHWKTYLRLDPLSPWASIARRELDKLYRETVVEKKERKQ
jgi:tetratricopeptide (TPR) repeat protein